MPAAGVAMPFSFTLEAQLTAMAKMCIDVVLVLTVVPLTSGRAT
jgi:hypothetical protein